MDNPKLKLKEIVPEYKSNIGPVRKLFWRRLAVAARLADIKNDAKVLDLGTGSGNLIPFLKRKVDAGDIYASDFNVHVLKLRKRFPKIHISRQDLLHTSFADSMFDVVFCLDVLEHIKDLDGAVMEIRRILKKDGQLILSVPKESFFYKLGRFLIKGSFSMESGPGSGRHYHDEKGLIRKITKRFFVVKKVRLKVFNIITLFTIYKLKVKDRGSKRVE